MTDGPHHVTVEVITDAASLEPLEGEWQDLWARCPRARVFQRPEWLLPWRRHLGPTAPRVLALRRGGALVGLVPLACFRRGDQRVLGLLGGGVSDVLDALIAPAHLDAAADALHQHLARPSERWDVLDLERLPPGSPLLAPGLLPGRDEVDVQEVCPVLRLPGCVADLRDVVSRRLLAELDAARRRLARLGQVSIARVRGDAVPAALERLLQHRGGERWSRRSAAGALADPKVQAFHREAAAALERSDLLRVHALRLDGRDVALLHALRDRDRVACYLGWFDPALERHDPVGLLLRAAIEDAVRAGARTLDFLSGREPWKYRWGGRDEPLFRRVLRPTAHRGAA